jgi:hypothetical protein
MLEEPGAVVPHAGILCGVRRVTGASTVTMKEYKCFKEVLLCQCLKVLSWVRNFLVILT